MTSQTPLSPAHPLSRWATLQVRATVALALALFLGITALRISGPSASDADGILYVLPVAVVALRFGLRGGLVSGLVALGLVVGADVHDHHHALTTQQSYLNRGIAFVLLGALVGTFVDRRRRLERQLLSYYNESLDMLATADMTGRFIRVNPAWERTLGHSAETMCAQPFIEFVHPDDRQATAAETASILTGSSQGIGFRNRYRAADGDYRWLEWSAVGSPSESVIHAVARDVTVQHDAETAVAVRTHELEVARRETLQRLALAAEYRDDDTYQHTARVGIAAEEIAVALGLAAAEVKLLAEAAPLHDIGKLAIPDAILLKPGALSAQEYEIMKTHAALGASLLSGSGSPVLQVATVIAASHHERWDGGGYPAGLAGEAIPLVGRVTAVADVFDVLTHDRPYKSAWTVEQAVVEIQRAAGSQFDPRVVAAFLTTHERVTVPPDLSRPPVHQTRRSRSAPAAAGA